jgi:hypothetical protein
MGNIVDKLLENKGKFMTKIAAATWKFAERANLQF